MAKDGSRERPNILVIMSDTHTAAATGCYGSEVARTPNLDRLAAEGVVFERAYCQNPLCVPSRQSLITGLRSYQTGVIHNDMPMPAMRTIAHILKESGYDTAAIGKMHFIPDTECSQGKERHFGFDRRVDYEEFYWYLRRERGVAPLDGQPDDPWRIVHLERQLSAMQVPLAAPDGPMRDGRYRAGTMAFENHQEALVLREWRAFLEERKGESGEGKTATQVPAQSRTRTRTRTNVGTETGTNEKPFLAFVSFRTPHPPLLPPPEFWEPFKAAAIPLPPAPDENATGNPFLGVRGKGAPDEERLRYLRHYHAFASFTDHCVGEALRALDGAGLANDTLVVYASDHGDMLHEHGMTGKMVFYENSVRVPLIIRWPGRVAGGWRYEGLVELLDLFPTLLEAAGAQATDLAAKEGRFAEGRFAEGRSLLPDLLARHGAGKEFVFSECYPMERNRRRFGDWPHRMVRTRDWKFIQYGPAREDLFGLIGDPGETRNRIGDAACGEPVCAGAAETLRKALDECLGPLPQPEERLLSGYYDETAGKT